jgi:hypothetical protein
MTALATKRGGRPIKLEHEKRSEQVKTRFTIAEIDHLRSEANKAGMTLADYVRRCSLQMRVIEKAGGPTPQVISELVRIGNNLNQIARALNAYKQPVPLYLTEALAKFDEILDQVAAAYVR